MAEGDRRRAKRVQRGFVVRYRRVWARAPIWSASTLADFSITGASFVSQYACAAGERLALQLLLPTSPAPVELAARVAWAKTNVRGEIVLGVKFDPITPETEQVLAAASGVFFHQGGWKLAGADRRKFPRLPQTLEAECRHYGAVADVWHKVRVQNLSAGGMNIVGDSVFEVGSLIEVTLPMPTLHGPMILRGRLLWGHLQEGEMVEHGVEFIDISAEQRLQIDTLVQFLKKP